MISLYLLLIIKVLIYDDADFSSKNLFRALSSQQISLRLVDKSHKTSALIALAGGGGGRETILMSRFVGETWWVAT